LGLTREIGRPIVLTRSAAQAGIEHAQRDITIASLYVGTAGEQEAQFVQALAAAARRPAGARPAITILADALRCTRPSKGAAGALGALASAWNFHLVHGGMCA
jgi:hypothetical protein